MSELNKYIFNEPKFHVPSTLIYTDKRGKEKVVPTLTPTGNLTTRNKTKSIQIIPDDDKFVIDLSSLKKYEPKEIVKKEIVKKEETKKEEPKKENDIIINGVNYDKLSSKEILDSIDKLSKLQGKIENEEERKKLYGVIVDIKHNYDRWNFFPRGGDRNYDNLPLDIYYIYIPYSSINKDIIQFDFTPKDKYYQTNNYYIFKNKDDRNKAFKFLIENKENIKYIGDTFITNRKKASKRVFEDLNVISLDRENILLKNFLEQAHQIRLKILDLKKLRQTKKIKEELSILEKELKPYEQIFYDLQELRKSKNEYGGWLSGRYN